MNQLILSKSKMNRNIEKIKQKSKNSKIMWILKDNAYGMGIKEIYSMLDEFLEKEIGVSTFLEACIIRKIEKDRKLLKSNIYIINKIDKKNVLDTIFLDLSVTIIDINQLLEYLKIVKEKNLKLKINIKLNTGMNRLGFEEKDLKELIEIIKKNINYIDIVSIFTHIGNYLEDENVENQNIKYLKMLNYFYNENINNFKTHLKASPTLYKYPDKYNYDMVRVGMALYGLNPLPEIYDSTELEQIFTLKTEIIAVKEINSNEKIGYSNKNYNITKIAIIPMGYSHGIIKSYLGKVEINKKLYDIVDICMDMIIINISESKIKVGDICYLINEKIKTSDIAKSTNTIADDIIAKLSYYNIERKVDD